MRALIIFLWVANWGGGRPVDRSCYDANGRVLYDKVAKTDAFNDGVKDLIRIALMCSEKEPLEGHRALLVAHNLAQRGVAAAHILAKGRLESHDEAMNRLLNLCKMLSQQEDLFPSRDELNKLIAEAVDRQAKRGAFVKDRMKAKHSDWNDIT